MITTHTSDPRPLVEFDPAPPAAGRCEKEPTPTHRSVAHSAENKTTTPAAAGIPLRFLPPAFLLLIPARMLLAVASAASVPAVPAAAGEGPRGDIAPPKIRLLRLLLSLTPCVLSFPLLACFFGALFLINEDHSTYLGWSVGSLLCTPRDLRTSAWEKKTLL